MRGSLPCCEPTLTLRVLSLLQLVTFAGSCFHTYLEPTSLNLPRPARCHHDIHRLDLKTLLGRLMMVQARITTTFTSKRELDTPEHLDDKSLRRRREEALPTALEIQRSLRPILLCLPSLAHRPTTVTLQFCKL